MFQLHPVDYTVWNLEYRPTGRLPGIGMALVWPSSRAVGWLCVGTYGQLVSNLCLDEEEGVYVERIP